MPVNGVESFASPLMWGGFIVFVLGMLAFDMLVLGGRHAHKVTVKEALGWSVAWVMLALLFSGLLWWYLDHSIGREFANQKSLEFLSGYLIEKSLSVDNIFVFLVIFGYFAVPAEMQRRVLFIVLVWLTLYASYVQTSRQRMLARHAARGKTERLADHHLFDSWRRLQCR